MIGRIAGLLLEKNPPQILVDCNGVGYEIDVPMSTFYNLPGIGERVVLHTHLTIREDAHVLFGFANHEERATFKQLIKISGIGARTALSILSGMSVADLAHSGGAAAVPDASSDILNALIALGYSDKESLMALKLLPKDCGVSDGIKLALKSLSK